MSHQRLISQHDMLSLMNLEHTQKRGRPVGSKDKNHQKINRVNNSIKDEDVPKEI